MLGFVPKHQCIRREHMPHVMEAWTVAVSCAAQADLARQSIERSMNVSDSAMSHVADTQWYLSSSPELMKEAMRRLERRWEDRT
ncbi:hypothetical protein [Sinorhizobium psoraleae]|uniref:hypothetical protein n=1 Tax=Sinorhizobium psoraleae TaxID=520838 RepID=UPI001FE50F71|nr:hypothetical protein [Sinorhizobium psoraleae]